MAEYSDEDEEGEFSSGEENDDAIDLGAYADRQKTNLRKYSEYIYFFSNYHFLPSNFFKGSNQVDSDSEFEMKDKGLSRAKISRVSRLFNKLLCWIKIVGFP